MLEEKVMRSILAYIKLIKRKIDSFNYAVDNPIYVHDNHNPFNNTFNKTYVWIDKNEDEEKLN